jgi:hypothetical protein
MTSQNYRDLQPEHCFITLPASVSVDCSVRAMYRELLNMPVPERFSRLLNQHESRLGIGGSYDCSGEPDPLSRGAKG